jgi:hypothetical protein
MLETTLSNLVEDEVAGDPMSDKKWIRCSLRKLSQLLVEQEKVLGRSTIRRLLKKMKYGLKGNNKRFTGPAHPQRNLQMRYIRRVSKLYLAQGHPVISVDSKKKELIGNFCNRGQVWCRQADEVNAHDFPQDALLRAVPYGIYDLAHNQGQVIVGTSADTPEFAVAAILDWWGNPNRPAFADESKLLILCDAGGSNGYRPRCWKQQLQQTLADAFGVEVMVCHYPTGASKWNPIEHRLFSQISLNWTGKPLRTVETLLGYIRDTMTTTGLTVKATLLDRPFDKGRKVSHSIWKALKIEPRPICPQWNYIVRPRLLPALQL